MLKIMLAQSTKAYLQVELERRGRLALENGLKKNNKEHL